MSAPPPAAPNYAFASDNNAGIAPDAWAALEKANLGRAASYGDDPWTARARQLIAEVFATDCEIFFVFNGTAANALALAHAGRSYQSVLCHELSHVDTDECGAPEFFSGGSKVIPVPGAAGKLRAADLEPALQRRESVHYPKPGSISLTQATELGTVYSPDEIRAIAAIARARRLTLQMDGSRFANAAATLAARGIPPADVTWRAGVDVLSFGGTKNGMNSTEAVVFFNRDLARDFDYRVKQAGQLASKARFAAAQWVGMLEAGAWLRHAAHANALARSLAAGLQSISGCRLLAEVEANGVFVEMPPALAAGLEARGWRFLRFVGDHGYRFMCSWNTSTADVAALLTDLRQLPQNT